MACAVEQAAVVLVCFSERYKYSPNCRAGYSIMSTNYLSLFIHTVFSVIFLLFWASVSEVLARHSEGPPFSAISSCDNLWLGIRLGLGLGLGSVVWLWQYQELFPATTMNDGFQFQNGGPFGMAALPNGGPEPLSRVSARMCAYTRVCALRAHARVYAHSCSC